MALSRRYDEVRTDVGRALHKAMLEYMGVHPDQEDMRLQLFMLILQEQKNNAAAIKQLSRYDYSHLEDALSLPFVFNRDNTERAANKSFTLLQLWFQHVNDAELIRFLVLTRKNPQSPTTLQLALKSPKVFFAYLDILAKLKVEKKIDLNCVVTLLQGRDQMGKNIFHTAADTGNIEIVEKLVNFTKALTSTDNNDLIALLLEIKNNYGFIPRFHRNDNTHPVNALLLRLNPEEQKRQNEEAAEAKQRDEDLKRFRSLNKRELELARRESELVERERKLARRDRFLESELAEANAKYEELIDRYQSATSSFYAYEGSLLRQIDLLEDDLEVTRKRYHALKDDTKDLDHVLAKQIDDLHDKDRQIHQLYNELEHYYYEEDMREHAAEREYREREYREVNPHRFYQPASPRDRQEYTPLHPPGSSSGSYRR